MDQKLIAFWKDFFPAAFGKGPQFRPFMESLRPKDLSRAGVRQWLLDGCAMSGFSPTEVARIAGLAPSTLNRFLSKESGKDNLSANTIDAVASTLVTLGGIKAVDQPLKTRRVWSALVLARIEAAPTEKFQWDQEQDYELRVPLSKYSIGPPAFGFELGDTYDAGYPTETILICSPAESVRLFPVEGQLYLVHFENSGKARTELRRLQFDPSGKPWLMPLPGAEGRALFFPDLDDNLMSDHTFVSMCVVGFFAPDPWTERVEDE